MKINRFRSFAYNSSNKYQIINCLYYNYLSIFLELNIWTCTQLLTEHWQQQENRAKNENVAAARLSRSCGRPAHGTCAEITENRIVFMYNVHILTIFKRKNNRITCRCTNNDFAVKSFNSSPPTSVPCPDATSDNHEKKFSQILKSQTAIERFTNKSSCWGISLQNS